MSQKVRKPKHQKRRTNRVNYLYGPKSVEEILAQQNKSTSQVNINSCLSCDRTFIDHNSVLSHVKTKKHKLRVKELLKKPYTIKDSEACGGLF